MSVPKDLQEMTACLGGLDQHLTYLKLSFIAENYAALAKQAAHKASSHVDYLATLVEGEANLRQDRVTKYKSPLKRG